jgi:hypothetical protein
MSWNELYKGGHWHKRSEEKNRVTMLVRQYIDPNCKPFDVPVDIEITACFDKRPLDADNIAAKFYIDALCGRYIHDDNIKYLHSVKTVAVIDKQSPRVEIVIYPAKTPLWLAAMR